MQIWMKWNANQTVHLFQGLFISQRLLVKLKPNEYEKFKENLSFIQKLQKVQRFFRISSVIKHI